MNKLIKQNKNNTHKKENILDIFKKEKELIKLKKNKLNQH